MLDQKNGIFWWCRLRPPPPYFGFVYFFVVECMKLKCNDFVIIVDVLGEILHKKCQIYFYVIFLIFSIWIFSFLSDQNNGWKFQLPQTFPKNIFTKCAKIGRKLGFSISSYFRLGVGRKRSVKMGPHFNTNILTIKILTLIF